MCCLLYQNKQKKMHIFALNKYFFQCQPFIHFKIFFKHFWYKGMTSIILINISRSPLYSLPFVQTLSSSLNCSLIGQLKPCSKCCTLKALSLTVSVQVQSVRYKYQTGQNPHGYNSVNYQSHYHWERSCQLSVSIKTLAIN